VEGSNIALMASLAKPLCFGEEYRPVKLSRYVYGVHDSGGNPFTFEKKLEWKLRYFY
jgi:hypothetical protein